MKNDYLKQNNAAFALQLDSFRNNIAAYATLLGLSPAEVTAQADDAAQYSYVLACLATMEQGAQQWSNWHKLLRHGGTPPPTGAPVAPVLGVAPTAVDLGIETRFRTLVRRIKAHPAYNPSIGEALGIEGAENAGVNLARVKPQLTLKVSGGAVMVGWGWSGHGAQLSMIRLEVDRAGGQSFAFLANDTNPGYTDTAPLPATPAKWTYRAMYYIGDQPVGQWSDPVSITVVS
ncbi:MAG: hypothetical protein ACREIF_03625 [Chthoniobacterales bacterium]